MKYARILCSVFFVLLFFFVQAHPANSAGEQLLRKDSLSDRPLLQNVEREIQAKLDELDSKLAVAAKELAKTGLGSQGARAVLSGICQASEQPFVVDCCTVDSKGRIVAIEPQAFKGSEGEDISGQEQIVRLHSTKQPVMSQTIAMVEGFDAVDIEHPVFSKSAELIGSVSILIKPEVLFAGVIQPAIKGFPVDMWVMEKNGRLLYDANEGEIGKNLFKDELYKPFEELQKLGRKISDEPSGKGSYTFYEHGTKTVISKLASWISIGLHGTDWRLVLIQKAAGSEIEKSGNTAPSGASSLIRTLCTDEELQSALAHGNEAEAMSILKKSFDNTQGVYSIQWVDASGRNRFGYPPENSLKDYSFKEGKSSGDERFSAAVASKKESTFSLPLVEGGTGSFYLHPIYWGDQYLGMIYSIERKP